MQHYITEIEKFWQIRDTITEDCNQFSDIKKIVGDVITKLQEGKVSVCEKTNNQWYVNEWIKKAILLYFKTSNMQFYDGSCMQWYDKIDPRFTQNNQQDLLSSKARLVPGSIVREGAYLGENAVVMPSFINIGAYIGRSTLIDSWSTVGSCAYIGSNCHISGGAGIGGVLEPLQAKPVIIEDNCFIGARSEIVEGVIVEEGAVISMGVFIGSSTKIVDRNSGEITYGRVPPYSVIVPGSLPADKPNLPSLYCAVILKTVDAKTRSKTAINELLR